MKGCQNSLELVEGLGSVWISLDSIKNEPNLNNILSLIWLTNWIQTRGVCLVRVWFDTIEYVLYSLSL